MSEKRIAHPAWLSRVASVLFLRQYATVFGSSLRGAGDPDIDYWAGIATQLAGGGWGLLSGGYQGTMSYLSSRHIKAGGHAVGITCFTVPDETPSGCYSEMVAVASPFERLEALLRLADAHIVLPGGIGTLVELTSTIWLQDRVLLPERPLLLLGSDWARWLEWFDTVPAGLRGHRPLRQVVTHVATFEQFEREWSSIANTMRA